MDDLAMIEARAAAALVAAGDQWTPLRGRLFHILASADRPLTAYDIAEALALSEGRRVAVATVYRILDIFVARRIVSRVERVNAYVVSDNPSRHDDAILLVCRHCGNVQQIWQSDVGAALLEVSHGRGFAVEHVVAELAGSCGACRP